MPQDTQHSIAETELESRPPDSSPAFCLLQAVALPRAPWGMVGAGKEPPWREVSGPELKGALQKKESPGTEGPPGPRGER